MAAIKSEAQSKTVVPPPRTFEEFLAFQNVDDWPRFPYMADVDVYPLVTKLKNDYALNIITKNLYDNAPLATEVISSLGERMEECRMKVHVHANHIFSLESSKKEIDDQQIAVPEQAVKAVDDSKELEKKQQLKIAVGATQDTSCKKIENYKFPGFKARKLTKLPNYLEAAQLWDAVLKVQTFKEFTHFEEVSGLFIVTFLRILCQIYTCTNSIEAKNYLGPKHPPSRMGVNIKVLKKLFLSEASLAILQDCFWWLFLQKFKPDQRAQDRFFDRISDSFVALLMSTPNYIKDPFFQTYPDCLSQTIYATFCEAFPESYSHFEDKFKDELMDLIFQWIRGFKPQKHAWKKWNLWWLEKPAKGNIMQESFQKVNLTKPQRMWSDVMAKVKTLRFQFPDEEPPPKPPVKPKRESHYVGDGPDFERSLFNLGGQSPLVSYYLKMHGISNTLENSRAYRISHTEVCTIPTPSSPTYRDVIEESTKFSGKLHSDFLKFGLKCDEELAVLEEKRVKVNKTYKRLLKTISKKPSELRLQTEKMIKEMENQKQTNSSSVNLAVKESSIHSTTKLG